MPTDNTKLKRAKNGKFPKYVGMNARGTKVKFDLGYDHDQAEARLKVIQALWNELESRFLPGQRAYWDKKTLKAAKAIEKGGEPRIPKRDFESPEAYVERLAALSSVTGQTILPADCELHQIGVDDLRSSMNRERVDDFLRSSVLNPPLAKRSARLCLRIVATLKKRRLCRPAKFARGVRLG